MAAGGEWSSKVRRGALTHNNDTSGSRREGISIQGRHEGAGALGGVAQEVGDDLLLGRRVFRGEVVEQAEEQPEGGRSAA